MPQHPSVNEEILRLASQLGMNLNVIMHELQWALGEQRIDLVTPTLEQFQQWGRQRDGLDQFWAYANQKLGTELLPYEVQDIWECIDLTLNARRRTPFKFEDYMMVATSSEQKCAFCSRRPPEVTLEIDHILPVSKGGTNALPNLRFLCQHHNRSRGNRFRWAEIWRRTA
jgi:hypothetical protein